MHVNIQKFLHPNSYQVQSIIKLIKFKSISSKEHFNSLKFKLYTNEHMNSGSIITSGIKWEVERHIFVNTASIT